jgi:riboflavin-specific deaminase-like protein
MEPIDGLLTGLSRAHGYADRPYVTLSYAQSLDGSLALVRGRPLRISGPESMRLTHRLRAVHDAILVGIGTVLADNPRLTVREVPGRQPHAVVLDPRLRLPPDSNLAQTAGRRVTVFCGETVEPAAFAPLEIAGLQVCPLRLDDRGWLPIASVLRVLRERGIERLMVEGGARVISSFLLHKMVDEVVLTISPVMVGGQHAVETPLGRESDPLPRLEGGGVQVLGGDIVVWGKYCP